MELSNYKVVIGFTDDETTSQFEHKEDIFNDKKYLLTGIADEKYTASWHLYNTSFVKKWIIQWERTIVKPHCVLVSVDESYFDINFPELVEYDEVEVLTEDDADAIMLNPGKHDLMCHWYRLYDGEHPAEAMPTTFNKIEDIVEYPGELKIRPAIHVCKYDIPKVKDDDTKIEGYPDWFRRGFLVLGKLMGNDEEFLEKMKQFKYPCRFSIVPVEDGFWKTALTHEEEKNA